MRVTFREPTHSDLDDLAATMRAIDIKECSALSGRTPRAAMEEGLETSAWTLVAVIDEKPVCIFGLTEGSFLGNDGVPWMLCAEGIERHARVLLTVAPRFVAQMRGECERLYNVVHADNRSAIRFIKWCGFDLGETFNVKGEAFIKFEWDREEAAAEAA